ncbi:MULTISPECIES: hypothetical protein [Enterobacter cloacae complex]|mgnify:CR=1 FL=1|uniref:hypothetical protein n=1 Tax=Enterobacter cloacae complex TaxID=354276 RepID=UPI000CDF0D67|nr:hypothetical protein [Enterobacter hormaechei]MBS0830050.1 hypothetical protein [Enterobacter hormaechei]QUP91948.1 hypothetical protein KFO54_05525 [Enterobacter hormaechei]RTN40586.1 hypothetical protein EKN84_20005 [Enterobacter hormaechei]
MSRENNGGPAFPNQGYEGLTIRDYFAAKAMQSIVSSPKEMESLIDVLGAKTAYAKVSETAYVIADEMLRAREAS